MQFSLRDCLWFVATVTLVLAFLVCQVQLRQSRINADDLGSQLAKLESELESSVKEIEQLQAGLGEFKELNREMLIAEWFAMRGIELEKMDRDKDAAASLEIAVRARPSNLLLIEKLLNCYQRMDYKYGIERTKTRLESAREQLGKQPLLGILQIKSNPAFR